MVHEGRLAQSGRALPLQGRSHRFNPVAPTRVFQKSSSQYNKLKYLPLEKLVECRLSVIILQICFVERWIILIQIFAATT